MERETQVQLIDRILQLEADNTTDMVERSGSVAVDQYLDTQQFANEEQALFRRLPLVLGHASQLPESGDFLTRDVCGVPVILLRDNQGVLRAFINVCKHRGGRLVREAEGKNLRVLVCQYHAWSYNTDGGLRAIPHRDGFSDLPDNCKSLSELPLLERYGLLWVRLTPYAADESQED
ncbi:MAG: Rieske (2Fe-2S) protein, partial [Pseudomonadota bacterium]|nr:Rieske (2Fe-2S) protein [Pseudomonadota bacterium]